MNVEKTIEFLLEHQARAEVRMDRIDKRLDGITKLMRMGAKAMLATGKKVNALVAAQKRTDEKIGALVEAQRRTEQALTATDERFKALIESQQRTDKRFDRFMEAFLKKGSNGRHN
jgi:hypothetical protein